MRRRSTQHAVAWGVFLAMLIMCPSSQADTKETLGEVERLTADMLESAKFMVIHINRAASASNLATAQAEAALARRFGQEMTKTGRKVIQRIEEVMAVSGTQPEVVHAGMQGVCYFREAVRHIHHVLQHTHHIQMSDSLRGGIAHVIDGARHARNSGNSVMAGHSYVTLLTQMDVAGGRAETKTALRLPFCGFGDEAHHDREIYLDVAGSEVEHHH